MKVLKKILILSVLGGFYNLSAFTEKSEIESTFTKRPLVLNYEENEFKGLQLKTAEVFSPTKKEKIEIAKKVREKALKKRMRIAKKMKKRALKKKVRFSKRKKKIKGNMSRFPASLKKR